VPQGLDGRPEAVGERGQRGAHLPSELRREVDKISRIDLFRSDFEQEIEIVEDGAWVQVTKKTTFFVNNPNSSRVRFPHSVMLEKTTMPDKTITLNRAGASGVLTWRGNKGDYDYIDPSPELRWTETSATDCTWEKDSYVPPNSAARSRFWNKTTQFYQKKDDLTFYSVHATVRFRISVTYPASFVVDVLFGYHDQKAVEPISNNGRTTVWSLPAAMLGMSAYTVSWYKKPGHPEPQPPGHPLVEGLIRAWRGLRGREG
jgi:hypothetical protein